MTHQEIPLEEIVRKLPPKLVRRLLREAAQLPESTQAKFVRNTARRLTWVVTDHPRTIFYAALGWAVGEVVDHVLTIPIPFKHEMLHLTADRAHEIAPVLGGILGFFEDRTERMNRHYVAGVIREEFQQALNGVSS